MQAASAPPAKRRAREALDAGLDSTPPAFTQCPEPRGGLRSDQPQQRRRGDRPAAGGGINSRLTSSLGPARMMASMSTGMEKMSAAVKKGFEVSKAVAARYTGGDRRSSGSAAEKRAAHGSGPGSRARKRKSASQVCHKAAHYTLRARRSSRVASLVRLPHATGQLGYGVLLLTPLLSSRSTYMTNAAVSKILATV